MQLGGTRTTVGTGGKIGPLSKQISGLQSTLLTVQGDPVAIQGVSGLGGQLGPALLQQTSLEDQLAQLGAGPLAAALAAAGSQAGAGNSSAMLGLEEQVASRLGELPPSPKLNTPSCLSCSCRRSEDHS